jgi:hypothetical protein
MRADLGKRPKWTGPDKWQFVLGALSLLVAIIACVGQFMQ